MATELEIRAKLDTMRSLPLPLARLANSISETTWPGQPTRFSLPEGMQLQPQQREEIQARVTAVNAIITGSNLTPTESGKGRLSLLTKMFLAFPAATGSSSEAAAEARSDVYDEALSDLPPWAIDLAIKRWVKGEVPDLKMGVLNFNFAPAPATLRKICKFEIEPFKAQAVALSRLLACVPPERAMDPAPLPQPEVKSAGGQVLQIGLRCV